MGFNYKFYRKIDRSRNQSDLFHQTFSTFLVKSHLSPMQTCSSQAQAMESDESVLSRRALISSEFLGSFRFVADNCRDNSDILKRSILSEMQETSIPEFQKCS